MSSSAVQQSDVSSTLPTLFPEDVLQALDGFVIIITPQGHIEFVSDNVTEILHYSPDELRGRSLYSFLAVDSHFELSNCLCILNSPASDHRDRPYVFNCRMSVKPRSLTLLALNNNKSSSSLHEQQRFENIQISVHIQQATNSDALQSPASQPPLSVTPTSVESAVSTKNCNTLSSGGSSDLSSADLLKSNAIVTNSSSTPASPAIIQSQKLVCIAKRRRSAQAAAHLLSHMGMQQFHMRLDLSGTILEYDGSGLHCADYQIPNCIGSNIRDFCIEHDRHLVDELFRTAIDKGTVWKVYRFKFSDNVYAFVQTEFSLVRNNANQPQCIYAIHTIVRECDSESILKGSSGSGLIKSVMQSTPGYGRSAPSSISSSIQASPSSVTSVGGPFPGGGNEVVAPNYVIPASQQSTQHRNSVQSSAICSSTPSSGEQHPNVVYNPQMQQMLDQNSSNNFYGSGPGNNGIPFATNNRNNSMAPVNNYQYYGDGTGGGNSSYGPNYGAAPYNNDINQTAPAASPYPYPAYPPHTPRNFQQHPMPGNDRRLGDMDPMSTGCLPMSNYPAQSPAPGYSNYQQQQLPPPPPPQPSPQQQQAKRMMSSGYSPVGGGYPATPQSQLQQQQLQQQQPQLQPPPLPSPVSHLQTQQRHHQQQQQQLRPPPHQMHNSQPHPQQNMIPQQPPQMFPPPSSTPNNFITLQSQQQQQLQKPSTYYDAPPPDRPSINCNSSSNSNNTPGGGGGGANNHQSVEMLEQLLGDPTAAVNPASTNSPSLLMMMMGPSDVPPPPPPPPPPQTQPGQSQPSQSPETSNRQHSMPNRNMPVGSSKRGDTDNTSRLKRSGSTTSPADVTSNKRGRPATTNATTTADSSSTSIYPDKEQPYMLDLHAQQYADSITGQNRSADEDSSIFSWLETDISQKRGGESMEALFNQVQPPSAIPTTVTEDPQQSSYVAEFMSLGQATSSDQVTTFSQVSQQQLSHQTHQNFLQDHQHKRQHARKTHKSASDRPLVAVVAPSSQPGPMPGQPGGGMMLPNSTMDYGQNFVQTNCPMDQSAAGSMQQPQMWTGVPSPMMSKSPGSVGSQGPYLNSPNTVMQNNWGGGMDMGNRFQPAGNQDRPGPIHDFVRQRLAGHCNNRQQQQMQATQRPPPPYGDYGQQPQPQQKVPDEGPRSQTAYLVEQPYGDPAFASPRSNMAPANSPRQSAAIMPMNGPPPRSILFPDVRSQQIYGNPPPPPMVNSSAAAAMIRTPGPSRPNNLLPMDRSPYAQSFGSMDAGGAPVGNVSNGGGGGGGVINYQSSALSQLLQDPYPPAPMATSAIPPPPPQMNLMLSSNNNAGGTLAGLPEVAPPAVSMALSSRNIDPSILEELLRD